MTAIPFRDDALQPFFKPGRPEIAVVTLLFWAAAAWIMMYGGIFPVGPKWLPGFVGWSLAAALLLRSIGEFRALGFFKRVRSTPFARMDTWVYSPLCLLLSALTVWMLTID